MNNTFLAARTFSNMLRIANLKENEILKGKQISVDSKEEAFHLKDILMNKGIITIIKGKTLKLKV